MLTAELHTNIDKKWEACWPINMLRPLVLLDLVSYLLFIQKLEENKLLARWRADKSGSNFIEADEKDELSWNNFKNLDAQGMHQIFTKERGLYDLIKSYGSVNLRYSLFVKEPLLLSPTAKLLANMVDIVKIIEAESSNTKAAIFDYLLTKTDIAGRNGQVYAPDYVVELMVDLMRPSPEDLIGDPSAGNGSFLVKSAMYIAGKNSSPGPNYKNHSATGIYKGIESDLIQLRIGAMNMILHGIEDPKLGSVNVLGKTSLSIREQPTLILSNLFFEGTEDITTVEGATLQTNGGRPETGFLNLILKSLKKEGRAAVIIREIILYDTIIETKTICKRIIDDYKLEAIISVPGKPGSLFSGACILVVTKPGTKTTDKVWFYKMSAENPGINQETETINTGKSNLPRFAGRHEDTQDILRRWEMDKDQTREETGKSFYVSVDEIRANNYNLNFADYRRNVKKPEAPASYKAVVPANKSTTTTTAAKLPKLNIENKKPVAQTAPVKKRSSVVLVSLLFSCAAIVAIYFLYFNNKSGLVYFSKKNTSLQTINAKDTAQKLMQASRADTQKSAEQFKEIARDTIATTKIQKKSQDLSAGIKSPEKIAATSNTGSALKTKKPAKIPEPAIPRNPAKELFVVTSKAYFHSLPDESTRSRTYINHWSNAVLNPIEDRNGFIYIVYTDPLGQTTKGWLNKNDLRQLQ